MKRGERSVLRFALGMSLVLSLAAFAANGPLDVPPVPSGRAFLSSGSPLSSSARNESRGRNAHFHSVFTAHASSVLRGEGQPSRSVWDGVYTEEQAQRGETLYQQECALCHLATLTGGESAPPLAGADFLSNWNGLTLGDLFERLRISMPPDQPDRLSRQQKIEILAYMLSVNKFPAGSRELPRETYALNQIRLDAFNPPPLAVGEVQRVSHRERTCHVERRAKDSA